MTSVIIDEPGKVRIQQIPVPLIKNEEVLVAIQYIGLCGTDLSTYRGLSPLVKFPRVPGHEVSGVIVSKGNAVPYTYQVGNKVTVNPYTSCGTCPACRLGRSNTCEFNQTLGVQRDGALSRLVAIPFGKILQSDILTGEEFALVEPLSVGYHATNRAMVNTNDVVVVIGCGMIGIGAIIACLQKGATVIATDPDDQKLNLVKSFGAHYCINAKEDVLQQVRQITRGEGANVAIEAVGLPGTYRLAIDAVTYAGRVAFIGYSKKPVEFDTSLFVKKELTIFGSRNVLTEFTPVIQMLEQKAFPFAKLITAVYPVEQTAKAFKDWDQTPGEFIKILIDVRQGGEE